MNIFNKIAIAGCITAIGVFGFTAGALLIWTMMGRLVGALSGLGAL